MRTCAMVVVMLCSLCARGQVRLSKLVLKPKEIYELSRFDILVVDSLIMKDSSKIILNPLKPDNFIHAKVAIFYSGTVIDGKGLRGLPGRPGKQGISPSSPCSDGGPGRMGTAGTDGGKGINLFLYIADVVFKGTLLVDVSGGDAGDGAKGGQGGGGGPGTRLCTGGNGGAGALGSNGGNGGNSGTVTFHSPSIPELRSMLGGRIVVRTYGGNQGLGADGGAGGFSGLSPVGNSKMDGKTGKKGIKGKDGLPGKAGAINFQDK